MDATTGQKLSQARIAKSLSVEEVAHATKVRPDKVLALERDDYSHFPNNAYARGFLQIYGRYLGVDVRAALGELENHSPVSTSEYQYLNSIPAKDPERIANRRKTGRPSLVPLIVFLMLCAVVGGGGYLYINTKRLGNLDQLASTEAVSDAPVETPKPAPAPTPHPESPAESASAEPLPMPADPVPESPAPEVAATSEGVASDREFVAQSTPPDVEETAAVINEVVIEPIRKTWVTVRKGSANSPPIFEDYLYTNAPALKLHGARFFIEVRDEGAVVIRKNGAPIAYQGTGLTIQ